MSSGMGRHDNRQGSPDRFGYSWERFSDLTADQEAQFRLWTTPLSPDRDWQGTTFLDAGCGAGRNSYWGMSYGAASCVAMDLDDRSLDAARRNLGKFPTAQVQKCSIYDIPYRDAFDIALSIGVIHHLNDPELAVRKLAQATKPGGKVLIWVYGYENLVLYVNFLNPLRKLLFSRIPLALVRWLAWLPAVLLWGLLRAGFTPLAYLRLLRTFPVRHIHHIVFDQMLPRTAFYWRREQAIALLEQAGLCDIRCECVNDVSWSVIGTKPVPA